MIQNKPLSDLALLTKREKDWILGNITISKAIQRDIRYRIRRKIQVLFSKELPLLMDKGFLVDKAYVLYQPGNFVYNADASSVATNDDSVVPNGDGSSVGGGRWASLVKIPQLTCAQQDDYSINSSLYGNENHHLKYEVGRVGFEPMTPAMSRIVTI
jgi:hypothetical protein